MSTNHETRRGQLGAAKRDTGQTRSLASEPEEQQLDQREARMGTRRRGPLGTLRNDPDATRSLDDAEVVETPPTECAEPPEDEDTTPPSGASPSR